MLSANVTPGILSAAALCHAAVPSAAPDSKAKPFRQKKGRTFLPFQSEGASVVEETIRKPFLFIKPFGCSSGFRGGRGCCGRRRNRCIRMVSSHSVVMGHTCAAFSKMVHASMFAVILSAFSETGHAAMMFTVTLSTMESAAMESAGFPAHHSHAGLMHGGNGHQHIFACNGNGTRFAFARENGKEAGSEVIKCQKNDGGEEGDEKSSAVTRCTTVSGGVFLRFVLFHGVISFFVLVDVLCIKRKRGCKNCIGIEKKQKKWLRQQDSNLRPSG